MKTKLISLLCLCTVFFCLVSCKNNQETSKLAEYQQKEARETKNIELVKKSIKFLDSSELDSLSTIVSEDFKLYMNSSKEPMSLNDFKPMHKMFYSAFPDYSHKIENVFASGDYVVVQVLLTGSHESEFQGIAPTNNKIKYKSIQVYKISEDKVDAVYAMEDDLTMLTQLGLELK